MEYYIEMVLKEIWRECLDHEFCLLFPFQLIIHDNLIMSFGIVSAAGNNKFLGTGIFLDKIYAINNFLLLM
jgi:hypothetical protein